DRQATRAAILAEEIERLGSQRVEMNRQLRPLEIDAPAPCLLDPSADLPLDLRRGEREALVGTPCRHPEGRRLAVAEIGKDGGGHGLDLERCPAGPGVVADAE